MKTFIATLIAATAFAAEGEFDYMQNGADWSSGVCASGQGQSPIDLGAGIYPTSSLSASVFGYDDGNNGHSIGLAAAARGKKPNAAVKMTLDSSSSAGMLLKRGDETEQTYWEPLQLHFHAPSEHTFNGSNYAAEMHIVHVPADGTVGTVDYSTSSDYTAAGESPLAVYGVWFEELDCESMEDEGGQSQCMETRAASDAFFSGMECFGSGSCGSSFTENVSNVPIQAFVDSLNGGAFFSYPGGLTTPPCTEGVRWTVVADPAPISPANLAALDSWYVDNSSFAPDCEGCSGGNNRQVMPVNDRTVYFNGAVSLTAAALGAIAALAF